MYVLVWWGRGVGGLTSYPFSFLFFFLSFPLIKYSYSIIIEYWRVHFTYVLDPTYADMHIRDGMLQRKTEFLCTTNLRCNFFFLSDCLCNATVYVGVYWVNGCRCRLVSTRVRVDRFFNESSPAADTIKILVPEFLIYNYTT